MSIPEYSDSADLQACSNCGRTFRPDVLMKHAPICRKASQKKRRVFESGKQRATGSDVPINKIIKVNQPPPRDPGKVQAAAERKHNWRQRHEDFIRNIRAAKQYQHAADTGAPLPPPPPPTIDPSLIQCNYCGRRFNEKAAERHIPFCREKNARISGPGGGGGGGGGGGRGGGITTKTNQYNTSDAHQKMAIRTQYQPPKPKVASSSSSTASRVPSGGAPLRTGKTVKDYMDARELAAESRGNSGGTGGRGSGGPARYGGGLGASPAARYGAAGGAAGSGGPARYGYGGGGGGGGSGGGASPSNGSAGYARGAPAGPRGGGGFGAPSSIGGGGGGMSNFCHECGNKYPTGTAKFCVQCGCKRMAIS